MATPTPSTRRSRPKMIFVVTIALSVVPSLERADWLVAAPSVIDVTTKGAVGDGVTNDAAAFAAAFAEARQSGLPVFLPPPPVSYYVGNTTFYFTTSIEVYGTGQRSVITADGGGGEFLFHVTSSSIRAGSHFHDFKIRFLTGGYAGAFRFVEARGLNVVERVTVEVVANPNAIIGVQITRGNLYSFNVKVRDCYFSGMHTGVDVNDTAIGVSITGCTFVGGNSDGSIGIKVAPTCASITMADNTFIQLTTGIYSRGGYLKIWGNYFEQNVVHQDIGIGAGNFGIFGTVFGNIYSGKGSVLIDQSPAAHLAVRDAP